METNNLTFRERIIATLLDKLLRSYLFEDITDEALDKILAMTDKLTSTTHEEVKEEETETDLLLNTELKDMDFPVLAYNAFRELNLRTIGDLIKISRFKFLSARNVGRKTLYKVEDILEELNLKFAD